ncbi:hypothetical protein TI03_05585, partial [Achromatium sp. WMS1]
DVVGKLTVTDPDGDTSFTYSVDDERFEVDGTGQLKLKTGIALDYEMQSEVNVTVTATDSGGLSKSQVFSIEVRDVDPNENTAPTSIALSVNTVAENLIGQEIGTLTVTDPDGDTSFTYRVDDERFEVNDTTLKLKTGRALDYEAEPTVEVKVTAIDSGGASKSQLFTIEVQNVTPDLNTGAPTNISLGSQNVTENVQGDVVGTLTVTDPDGDTSFTYSVDDERFEIDGTGQLKLKAGNALDYEVEPTVDVTVTAIDSGGLSTSQLFTITVDNVDPDTNSTPTNISLNDQKQITEGLAGDVVGTLTVTDPDGDTSFTYRVDDERFEVNGTGQLKLKAGTALNYETDPTVDLVITATDSGGLSKSQHFTITVQDVPADTNNAPSDINLD